MTFKKFLKKAANRINTHNERKTTRDNLANATEKSNKIDTELGKLNNEWVDLNYLVAMDENLKSDEKLLRQTISSSPISTLLETICQRKNELQKELQKIDDTRGEVSADSANNPENCPGLCSLSNEAKASFDVIASNIDNNLSELKQALASFNAIVNETKAFHEKVAEEIKKREEAQRVQAAADRIMAARRSTTTSAPSPIVSTYLSSVSNNTPEAVSSDQANFRP